MNYTSIEQSKKLIEAGLDPKTADMFYSYAKQYTEDGEKYRAWIPVVGIMPRLDERYYKPCWSLGALIELMPKGIYEKGCMFHLTTFHDLASIQYTNLEANRTLQTEVWGTADPKTNGYTYGVFSMVLWLLENNYIKKN